MVCVYRPLPTSGKGFVVTAEFQKVRKNPFHKRGKGWFFLHHKPNTVERNRGRGFEGVLKLLCRMPGRNWDFEYNFFFTGCRLKGELGGSKSDLLVWKRGVSAVLIVAYKRVTN